MSFYANVDEVQLRLLQHQYERNLAHLLSQQAKFGTLHVPTHVYNEIYDTQQILELINQELEKRVKDSHSHVVNSYVASSSTISDSTKEDWNGAIDSGTFYGRNHEVFQLSQMLGNHSSRLIMLIGIGGIGKTTLSLHVTRTMKESFSYIFWRSLRNAPPLTLILNEAIRFLSDNTLTDLPERSVEQVQILLDIFTKKRCLIILDNTESILREKQRSGHYKEGYKDYAVLFQMIGEREHQSCLLLTGREKLKDVLLLESTTTSVQIMTLTGLSNSESRTMLQDRKLVGSERAWSTLIQRFSGNPLALKLVANPIRELFDSNIDTFLREGVDVFDDIYHLLEEQFNRLSDIEKEIMYWLAINRDIVSPSDLVQDFMRLSDTTKDIIYWLVIEREHVSSDVLLQNLVNPISRRELLDELGSLKRRNLIEVVDSSYTLQPVVMEYMTTQLIDKIHQEIVENKINLLASHSLMKAEAKDYLRLSQVRVFIDPIAKRLTDSYQHRSSLEIHLKQILNHLQQHSTVLPGYAAGNLLNILVHLKFSLNGYDLSRLTIAQAYLPHTDLYNVNMAGSNLEHSVFRETFGSIFSTAFSPDGQNVAAGSVNGEIRSWKLSDRTHTMSLSDADLMWTTTDTGDDWVWSVAYHPTLPILASGNDNHSVKIWDTTTGMCIQSLLSHTSRVWSVCFSPDGDLLATSGDDKVIRLWDWQQGIQVDLLIGHISRVVSTAFSSDGKILASASDDCMVKLWDVPNRRCVNTLEFDCKVVSLAFNDNGSLLAIGNEKKKIELWNVTNGYYERNLRGHTARITSLAFSSDGAFLVSGSDDTTLRIWEVATGDCRHVLLGHENIVYSVSYSRDGITIASGSEDQTLKLWDVVTGQCLRTLQGYTNQVWSLAVHPEQKVFASGHEDRVIRLWSVETAQCIMTFTGHTNRIRSITFSSRGNIMASASEDMSIKLWDIRSGHCIRTLRGHTNIAWSVSFNQDGSLLASSSDDQTIRIWDVRSGQCKQVIHENSIPWSVLYTQGGLLISGFENGEVKVYDATNGYTEIECFPAHEGAVRSLSLSADEQLLITSCGETTIAKIWNMKTYTLITELKGHTHYVKTSDFNHSVPIVATGSDDYSVKIWNPLTGECISTLEGHINQVKSVRFIVYGSQLISCGEDELIKIWDLSNGHCLHTLTSKRPYEGLNITDTTGLTLAQKASLKTLGAVDETRH